MNRLPSLIVLLFVTGCAEMDPQKGVPEAEARVRQYIVDAYEWELAANPPMPDDIQREMRAILDESKLSGKLSIPESLPERMQTLGQRDLADRARHMASLEALRVKHWIGDHILAEAATLCNPPKHDPKYEIVTGSRLLDDNTVEVVTYCDGGQLEGRTRRYILENHDSEWRIRTYNADPPNGG